MNWIGKSPEDEAGTSGSRCGQARQVLEGSYQYSGSSPDRNWIVETKDDGCLDERREQSGRKARY